MPDRVFAPATINANRILSVMLRIEWADYGDEVVASIFASAPGCNPPAASTPH
jgi:hypothetical protein